MVDTSRFTGGGQPTGRRSRRSRTGPIDTGGVSERTQRTTRRVNEGVEGQAVAAGLETLSNSLGAFFPVLEKERQNTLANQVAENQRQNAESINAIEAKVRANPDKARLARQTGDYSFFAPDDPRLENRLLMEAFSTVTAQTMAGEDFEQQVIEAINQTPLEGDPDDAVNAIINQNIEGANPLFANNYSLTMKRAAAPMITNWKNERAKLQHIQNGQQMGEYVRQQLKTTPPTLDTIESLRAHVIGASTQPAPLAVAQADALVDNEIIRRAPHDPQVLRLAHMPDPKRDGTSVATRNPGAIQKATKAAMEQAEATQNLEVFQAQEALERRFTEATAADEGWVDLYIDTARHIEIHGDDSQRIESFFQKVAGKLDQDGINMGAFQQLLRGELPALTDKEHNALSVILNDPERVAALAARFNTDPTSAQVRVTQYLAGRGPGKEQVQKDANTLLADPDAAQAVAVANKYWTYEEAGPGGWLPERAQGLAIGMRSSAALGGMEAAQEFRKRFLEFTRENGTQSITGAFGRILVDPSKTGSNQQAGRTYGSNGTNEFAMEAWNGIRETLPTEEGMFFGVETADWDELPLNVRQMFRRQLDVAAVTLAHTNAGPDEIAKLAGELARTRLAIDINPDGVGEISLNKAPAFATAPGGTIMKSGNMTPAAVTRFNEWRDGADLSILQGDIGARQDDLTTAGHGLQLTSNANGWEQPVLFMPGRPIGIDLATAGARVVDPSTESALGLTIMERDVPGNTVVLEVPDFPEPGEPRRRDVDANTFLVFDDQSGFWSLRYRDVLPGHKQVTNADLGAMNKRSLEREIEAYENPPTGDEILGIEPASVERSYFLDNAAPLGSPVPGDETRGAYSPDQLKAVRENRDQVLDGMAKRGLISPESRVKQSGESDLKKAIDAAISETQDQGAWLDDLNAPSNTHATNRLREVIERHEGRVLHVYDDATGRRWKANGKNRGNPTIGIGYNIRQLNSRKHLEKAGIDLAAVMQGAPITDGQAVRLFEIAAQDIASWVRKQFKGQRLTENQWLALTELAYNGPATIGPRIRQFVGEGDWHAVANEIRTNTTGGIPAHLKSAVRVRRQHTARMFLGLE